MATAQQSRPASHGSRTLTINQISTDEAGPSNQVNPPVGVLKLRGGPSRKAKVEWSEEVVDNEGMGRKKSKICCIYNKPRAFDESSSESGSGSEDDREEARRRAEGKDNGKGKIVRRKVEGQEGGEVSEPESESDGGGGDGRARPARKSARRRHRHHHDHDHDHGADGHGCADQAAKPNKYDAQPRGVPKVTPTI